MKKLFFILFIFSAFLEIPNYSFSAQKTPQYLIKNIKWTNSVDNDIDGYTSSRVQYFELLINGKKPGGSDPGVEIVLKYKKNGIFYWFWKDYNSYPSGWSSYKINVGSNGKYILSNNKYDFIIAVRILGIDFYPPTNDNLLIKQKFATISEDKKKNKKPIPEEGNILNNEQVSNNTPQTITLYQNYPNPFNPLTTIEYIIQDDSYLILTVFNINGQKIITLEDGYVKAGKHSIQWNGTNMPSGIYLYQLRTNEFVETKRMTLIK